VSSSFLTELTNLPYRFAGLFFPTLSNPLDIIDRLASDADLRRLSSPKVAETISPTPNVLFYFNKYKL
jgi:hypothetical protein